MTGSMDDLFRQRVRQAPDHPAIVGPQPQAGLTYRELDQAIAAASERLRAVGVRRGDCVGLHLPSTSQYIIWNYAVWRCGGCVVPIPVELASDEKVEIFRQIALDWWITPRKSAGLAGSFRGAEASDLTSGLVVTSIRSPQQHPRGFASIDGAFIRFTSGTTGSSKGVVLSHRTIAERILAANEALHIEPSDRIVWVLSMSYHFTVSIVGYLTLGATIILPAHHLAAAIWDAIEQHEATILYASPMHFALLADSPPSVSHARLRLAISTTSSLDGRVAEAFHRRCGRPISQALGVIEMGLPCINVEFAAQSPGSVGPVLPAYDVRLDDVGLGPDKREILFRGPGFLDAYYHPWRTRDQILEDGWFRTGDIGRIDENGCLFLEGRSTDVINAMGMKFFPQEVERVLTSHPRVKAAVVYAKKGGRFGETAHARVVARTGGSCDGLAEELRQFCSQRLASYKVPERIELVGSLPRTASGKVLHRVT